MRTLTQGVGTGAGLGSQAAVTLSRNGHYLFVVNTASNTVSTFAVRPAGLVLKSVVDSGGLTPTSVAEHNGLVYVLNAGGIVGVAGLRNDSGNLRPIAGAAGTLSASSGTAPAQVGFSEDGDVLVITERNTQRLTSFLVKRDGTLDSKTVTASSGAVPFGFAFTRRDTLVVSKAPCSAVSSYRFSDRSATPDGWFAFSANAGTKKSEQLCRGAQRGVVAGGWRGWQHGRRCGCHRHGGFTQRQPTGDVCRPRPADRVVHDRAHRHADAAGLGGWHAGRVCRSGRQLNQRLSLGLGCDPGPRHALSQGSWT